MTKTFNKKHPSAAHAEAHITAAIQDTDYLDRFASCDGNWLRLLP
jgi:hypothetical protein